MGALPQLRHEPTAKRVRAMVDGMTVVDSLRALMVWEPRRVVSAWAVPADDIAGELRPSDAATATVAGVGLSLPDVSDRPVLDPSVPFAAHTADGETLDLDVGSRVLVGAGLRLADPDLAGYVVLDFAAFDQWLEEDETNIGHPREPFHRIDVVASSRTVGLELEGVVLADTVRASMVFETMLPVRFYLPRDDVRVELRPSATTSTCAYKGHASYWSAVVRGRVVEDLAWSYEQPLREAAPLEGMVCFFDERVDLSLDGVRRERPVTPWS